MRDILFGRGGAREHARARRDLAPRAHDVDAPSALAVNDGSGRGARLFLRRQEEELLALDLQQGVPMIRQSLPDLSLQIGGEQSGRIHAGEMMVELSRVD